MSNTLLEVSQVFYSYGSGEVLKDVSFDINSGEIVVLAGPNGAGKSTLLRCIAGWTKPAQGEIKLLGKGVYGNERLARHDLILVPDTPPFYEELNAWEHLQYMAQVYRFEDWEDEASELLKGFLLWSNRNSMPATFSRGMRYKLALCMSLLLEPGLLLLDEPFGPLDPITVEYVWAQFKQANSRGMSFLISSHQLPSGVQPDRYIVIGDGEILAQGSPEALSKSLKISQTPTLESLLRAAIDASAAGQRVK
jgi:ABC-2 type transport system ATP-binding protein